MPNDINIRIECKYTSIQFYVKTNELNMDISSKIWIIIQQFIANE